MSITSFSPGIGEKIKWYVYRLLDPRNGETFYVGKGNNDRVFEHAIQAEGDEQSDKLNRIREIHNAGHQVIHLIHRHGLEENEALVVEAALIDAYPGLTNEQGGQSSGDYGVMHADDLEAKYAAKEAHFEEKAILICVNQTSASQGLYEAVRFCWKLDPQRAAKADIVCATINGVIREVFVANEWLEATAENFPGRQAVPGRYGFNGSKAPADLTTKYLGKRVPEKFRRKGAANPVRYTYES